MGLHAVFKINHNHTMTQEWPGLISQLRNRTLRGVAQKGAGLRQLQF